MSQVGLTRDAGWEIGVSRTLPHEPAEVWQLLTSREGLRLWLGELPSLPTERGAPYETADGAVGEVRGFREGDRIRVTHRAAGADHETTCQVTVRRAARGTRVNFHQERLRDADERERRRTHWQAVIDRLADALG